MNFAKHPRYINMYITPLCHVTAWLSTSLCSGQITGIALGVPAGLIFCLAVFFLGVLYHRGLAIRRKRAMRRYLESGEVRHKRLQSLWFVCCMQPFSLRWESEITFLLLAELWATGSWRKRQQGSCSYSETFGAKKNKSSWLWCFWHSAQGICYIHFGLSSGLLLIFF